MSTQPMVLEDTAWTDDAQDWIIQAAKTGTPFDVNDLRREMRPAPRSALYGAAFLAAFNRGLIQSQARSRAAAKSSHGRSVNQWSGVPTGIRVAA